MKSGRPPAVLEGSHAKAVYVLSFRLLSNIDIFQHRATYSLRECLSPAFLQKPIA